MSNNTTNNPLMIVGAVVVALGVGFFGGMKYQETKAPSAMMALRNGTAGAGMNQRGAFGQRRNGGAVIGEILSSDDKTITVKMQDGSSKIVVLSNSTGINKASQGSKTDLKKGEHVAVFGTPNSDGSVTAQSIQLNPLMRMGTGQPRPSPAP